MAQFDKVGRVVVNSAPGWHSLPIRGGRPPAWTGVPTNVCSMYEGALCRHCQAAEPRSLGLCMACYVYQRRHNGEPRPLEFEQQRQARLDFVRHCNEAEGKEAPVPKRGRRR